MLVSESSGTYEVLRRWRDVAGVWIEENSSQNIWL
jgi:hypothetical protein